MTEIYQEAGSASEDVFAAVEFAPEFVERYTTADSGFDGFGTHTIEVTPYVDNLKRPIRKIGVRPQHLEWQAGKNGSAARTLWSKEQFETLVDSGVLKAVVYDPDETVSDVETVIEPIIELIAAKSPIKLSSAGGDTAYVQDLESAIEAGIFTPSARPKIAVLLEAIKEYNEDIKAFNSGKSPASETQYQVSAQHCEITAVEEVDGNIKPEVIQPVKFVATPKKTTVRAARTVTTPKADSSRSAPVDSSQKLVWGIEIAAKIEAKGVNAVCEEINLSPIYVRRIARAIELYNGSELIKSLFDSGKTTWTKLLKAAEKKKSIPLETLAAALEDGSI